MARAPRATSSRKRRSRPTPRWLTKKPDLDAVARNRVLLVLSVLSGERPVTSAIEEAGISRGLYYQLETRALNAMLLALAPGAEGDPSSDATGLHQRIKTLEDKLSRAEQAQRRAERLLFMHRKLTSVGPMKTNRGPQAKKTTSSTPAGRRSWRSSTTTKPTKQAPPPASTPMPAGANAAP
jgi:hypothetical protein